MGKRSNRKQNTNNIVPYGGGYYNYQSPPTMSQYGAYFGMPMDSPYDAPYYGMDGMLYGSEIFYGPPVAKSAAKPVVKNGTSASSDVSKSDSKLKASASNMSP